MQNEWMGAFYIISSWVRDKKGESNNKDNGWTDVVICILFLEHSLVTIQKS